MKAKEYYAQYKEGLMGNDEETRARAAHQFGSDLLDECRTVAELRHVKFDKGFIPILREQNDKYKAVIRLFVKEYGSSPLREDGFEMVLEDHFPGMVEKMKHPATCGKVDTHTREAVSDA